MERFRLQNISAIAVIASTLISCSFSKTIEEPKWGFKFDVPATLEEKQFEDKNLWVHEDDQIRVVVDFGTLNAPTELKNKKDYTERFFRVNGYNAIICTYVESEDSERRLFENVATLIFQESPKSYGEGKPPVFRVEYGSEKDLGTALQILQSVRFFDPLEG
jgi:hypothetical protein